MARLATDNLNHLGNFDYRNHIIGNRTITLEKIQFDPFTSRIWRGSRPSLDLLGSVITNAKLKNIHIVAYQKNNKPLAKARALSVKNYLITHFRTIKPEQINASWFDVPEEIKVKKKLFKEDESINCFTKK